MILPAKLYEAKLTDKFLLTYDNPKYKYFYMGAYNFTPNIETDDWNYIKRVSILNDEVVGFLSATVSRSTYSISELGIINFTDEPFVFARDLASFINMLLYEYNFYKIKFSAVSDNPSIKMYERFVNKYDGREIGMSVADCRLRDGRYYTVNYYEIFRQESTDKILTFD